MSLSLNICKNGHAIFPQKTADLNGIAFQFWPEPGKPRQTSLEIRKMLYKTALIFERSHSDSGDIFGVQHMLMKILVINFENLNISFRFRSTNVKAFSFILIYLYFFTTTKNLSLSLHYFPSTLEITEHLLILYQQINSPNFLTQISTNFQIFFEKVLNYLLEVMEISLNLSSASRKIGNPEIVHIFFQRIQNV